MARQLNLERADCKFVPLKQKTRDRFSFIFSQLLVQQLSAGQTDPFFYIAQELRNTPVLLLWSGYQL